MNIALLEPYMTNSHRQWAKGYKEFSKFNVDIFSLPGKHWKWRMHGGAITLSYRMMKLNIAPDLILASEMLDINLLKAQLFNIFKKNIPIALYFHENQFVYPWSDNDPDVKLNRDLHYNFINYSSALTSHKVFFNSHYNMETFISSLNNFLENFPDYRNMQTINLIKKKSSILPLGIDTRDLEKYDNISNNNLNPTILWNHRWEYDKNPKDFLRLLICLKEKQLDFNLIVIGKSGKKYPKEFDEIKNFFSDKIIYWGFANSRSKYIRLLHQSDILPVTSKHDFFGISVMEAIHCNNIPILPNNLSYPEIYQAKKYPQIFYNNFNELLEKTITAFKNNENQQYRGITKEYSWNKIASKYDNQMRELCF